MGTQDLIITIVMTTTISKKKCMFRKQNEKKEKEKDEAYYVHKLEDHRNLKLTGKTLIVEENASDSGNIEVWSTNSEDDEVSKIISQMKM